MSANMFRVEALHAATQVAEVAILAEGMPLAVRRAMPVALVLSILVPAAAWTSYEPEQWSETEWQGPALATAAAAAVKFRVTPHPRGKIVPDSPVRLVITAPNGAVTEQHIGHVVSISLSPHADDRAPARVWVECGALRQRPPRPGSRLHAKFVLQRSTLREIAFGRSLGADQEAQPW